MNLACARIKIIRYVVFVSTHVTCIWHFLQAPVCFVILTAFCMPSWCFKLPVSCFIVCWLTHNSDYAKQFYILHPEQCWPLSGATKNLHLTHLSSSLIFTEHLPSCSMFDWLYVLSTIDLFILAFNSTMVNLGNGILKILNGIRFPYLPVSILYTCFVLFWLVLNSFSLLNTTDCKL